MALNLRSFFSGPDWVEVNLPDWFEERAAALVKTIGEDHADVQLFKEMLAAGKVTEDAAIRADALAGATQHGEVFLLAIDIASHAFSVLQVIAQTIPSAKKAA